MEQNPRKKNELEKLHTMKKIFLFLLTLVSIYSIFSQNKKVEYRFTSQKPDTIICIPDSVKVRGVSDSLNIKAYQYKDSSFVISNKKRIVFHGLYEKMFYLKKTIHFDKAKGKNVVEEKEEVLFNQFALLLTLQQ